ncbi:MAG: hypothetical protein J1F63_04885 [Oscillospiraceae bacterium]|nr:hypothetical protein [Oscillospiraceae bacterium]
MDEKKNPVTFDEALEATEEQLLAQAQENTAAQADAQAAQETDGRDASAQESEARQEPRKEEPKQTDRQQAAQSTPPGPDPMRVIAGMQQQMSALAQQNRQLREALKEQSAAAEQRTAREALEPPRLDMSGLAGADENVIRQKQQEYAGQMADFVKKQVLGELSPYIENVRAAAMEKAQQEALRGLSEVPELSGIMGMTPTLERIIQSNPALANSSVPIEDKLITAYAIARGAEAIKNPPKAPGVEDFMQLYKQNPELQAQVEAMRAQNAAKNAAQLPPMSASAGAAGVALTPPQNRPKTFDEAKAGMFARLGL